ncbi:hypothetical protein [Longimicrobium sp.]|jgi:hypothetical protein|uniref:hypothetical protein n=1 Tax=Longimicrobium sp. TaxID=2029185 RepID=UPI002ED8B076
MTYARTDPFAADRLAEADAAAAAMIEAAEAGASTGPSTLSSMGEALLEIVKAAALAKGTPLPARQSVYMAPIPADCEQVAVLFTGWNPTPAADGPTICKPWRWMGSYSVIITRCTPAVQKGKTPPSMEMMIEAARLASSDAEILLEAVNRLDEIGSDISVVTNAPSGGFQTVELNVQLLAVGTF